MIKYYSRNKNNFLAYNKPLFINLTWEISMKKILLSILITALTSYSLAEGPDLKNLKSTLQPGIEIQSVKPSPVKGIYQVRIASDLLYLTEDGKFLFTGQMYDLVSKANLTEKASRVITQEALAAVPEKDKIIYKAPEEKYKISVFTDISCPYCTKLHQHMDDFNQAGITVEYLAFPRAGANSAAAKNMQRIWCAQNKTQAMNEAKNHKTYPEADCEGQQAKKQFELGRQLGISATPTLIFSDGQIKPGYVNRQQLLALLKEKFPDK